MRDDYASPVWAERHGEVSGFLGGLLDQTRVAFERLAARTFDAPWKQERCGRGEPLGKSVA